MTHKIIPSVDYNLNNQPIKIHLVPKVFRLWKENVIIKHFPTMANQSMQLDMYLKYLYKFLLIDF